MGLSFSQGRMFLLLQRGSQSNVGFSANEINQRRLTLSKQLEETSNEFLEGKEYIENFTKSQVDTSIEEVPNDTILANLGVGINKPKKSDTDEKLRNETILKNEAQSKLNSLEEKIKEAEECSTTRSQKQIEKDIKNIETKIKKNTKYKKEKVSCEILGTDKTTNKKGKLIKYEVTLSDKSTRTFKSEKEYQAFIKSPYTYKNTLVETPQLKKLNEQKQKLQTELASAKSRDSLPELQKEAEQFKSQIAKHDENIKELEAKKQKEAEVNNQHYDAAAKRKYDKLQEQIQNRDNKLEMELDNLETQRNAVTTEIEEIQKIIDDNLKRTLNYNFNINQFL